MKLKAFVLWDSAYVSFNFTSVGHNIVFGVFLLRDVSGNKIQTIFKLKSWMPQKNTTTYITGQFRFRADKQTVFQEKIMGHIPYLCILGIFVKDMFLVGRDEGGN